KLVDSGKFREDLYYRLNVLPLQIPSLKDRKEDVLSLIEYYFSKQFSNPIVLIDEVKHLFLTYSWPGNIRELENTVYYLSAIIKDNVVNIDDLPDKFFKKLRKNDFLSIEELELEGSLTEFLYILSYLYEAKQHNWKTGRTVMEAYFKKQEIPISAQQIKSRMAILKKYRLVEIGSTRQGSWITQLGIEALKSL
ncbi:MAG TPA: hypothetical protein VK190_09630, partial [Pseudoneobacillus sp.]|nr:hypothetical protein [Pseudoneobacillus sp.]